MAKKELRVAHIITRMILGGAQENTLYTVQGLHELPHYEVCLVTGPAIGPEGELVQAAEDSGVELILVPAMRREIHPGRDLATYLDLVRILREWRPDIVHTHSSKAGILGRLAAHWAGVPLIIHTIHGQAFHPNQNLLTYHTFAGLERWCSQFTDEIFTVCDAMAEQAVDEGLAPASRFVTVYSGMDVSAFESCGRHRARMRRTLGFEDDDIVVGKIARIAHLKGYEYMLELARRLVPDCSRVRFLFVGDGELRGEIEAGARASGIRDRIVFSGLVPASEVPKYLSTMDILVHTSLREGLARVLPQALIAGKPVVSFDVDGAREVVLNNETGFLVRPKSQAELYQCVRKLVETPELRSSMGRRGQELFTQVFDKSAMVSHIDSLYQELWARKFG